MTPNSRESLRDTVMGMKHGQILQLDGRIYICAKGGLFLDVEEGNFFSDIQTRDMITDKTDEAVLGANINTFFRHILGEDRGFCCETVQRVLGVACGRLNPDDPIDEDLIDIMNDAVGDMLKLYKQAGEDNDKGGGAASQRPITGG